jgi:serine O-acetyltransferase
MMQILVFMLSFIVFFIALVLIIAIIFAEEIRATKEKDPAARGYLEIILLYSGLHALIAYRIAHSLWKAKLYLLARLISQCARFWTGIEIHPGALIGKGFFIDHGMGVVIGETTIVGDNVTLYQGVTLGGTGKETGKRHPTLGDNIVVGAGAKVLGNIEIGSNSYIGANAVVLRSMPENTTVVGVPARITKQEGKRIDYVLDHTKVLDPVVQQLEEMQQRIEALEKRKS